MGLGSKEAKRTWNEMPAAEREASRQAFEPTPVEMARMLNQPSVPTLEEAAIRQAANDAASRNAGYAVAYNDAVLRGNVMWTRSLH